MLSECYDPAIEGAMPSEFEEQSAIQRNYLGRPESPLLEAWAAIQIASAFRTLIEERYFYQKTEVDFPAIVPRVRDAFNEQLEEHQYRQASPGSGFLPWRYGTFEERRASLLEELESREWVMLTRHLCDTAESRPTYDRARQRSHIGGSPETFDVPFLLPSVELKCAKCRAKALVDACLASTPINHFEHPFPRASAGKLEQTFTPITRYGKCRESLSSPLVRRPGKRVHLCGFAPRRVIDPPKNIPEPLKAILADAEQAVAEGDHLAAFYHLRTMMEHHMKARLGIPVEK